MRCLADVQTKNGWGFYRTDPDPRCTRQAVRHGYCTQHHKKLWQAHDRIVDRILSIPPRP
jgi:hypothetical protein